MNILPKIRKRRPVTPQPLSLAAGLVGLILLGLVFFGAGCRRAQAEPADGPTATASAPSAPAEVEAPPTGANQSPTTIELLPTAGPGPAALPPTTANEPPAAEDASPPAGQQMPGNRPASEGSSIERVVFVKVPRPVAP